MKIGLLDQLKTGTSFLLSLLCSASFYPTYTFGESTTELKPHVHGVARLILAIEDGKSGSVEFEVPSNAIYGFEHEAQSKKDKLQQSEGLKKLEKMAGQIIEFESKQKCKIADIKVETELHRSHDTTTTTDKHNDDDHKGSHSEVNAQFTFSCELPISGSKVSTKLFNSFAGIQKIELNILNGTNQISKNITNSKENVIIP